jgi:molybdopterin synthase sulfur carrier subunit
MEQGATIQVLIPTPLRRYTGGESKVAGSGQSVSEVLVDLNARFPGFMERVCEPDGEIRRFVNVFVNGENVRNLQGAATAVKGGDELGIIPAMAGGR